MALSLVAGTLFYGFYGKNAMSQAQNWQLSFPDPVTPIAKMQLDFHNNWLLPIVFGVSIFVLLLLVYTCWRFSAKNNPTPSKTTHNVKLEVIWTAIPALILVVLAFPSMKILFATDDFSNTEMTLKVTGYQWYWNYEYPDHGGFSFDAYLEARTQEEAEELGVLRLMDTDHAVVLPVDTNIRLQIISGDVLHSWAVSAFGVRMDAVPGRLNEVPVKIEKTGRYYGFCSELCGIDHAYMPIMVDVVSKEAFAQWVKDAQAEFASHSQDRNIELAKIQ